jgi:hypothetical protein
LAEVISISSVGGRRPKGGGLTKAQKKRSSKSAMVGWLEATVKSQKSLKKAKGGPIRRREQKSAILGREDKKNRSSAPEGVRRRTKTRRFLSERKNQAGQKAQKI